MNVKELIDDLCVAPEPFNQRWRTLQQAYDHGHPIESLVTLLEHPNVGARRSTLAVADATQADLAPIADRFVPLFTDEDEQTSTTAIACSLFASPFGYANVLALLEHPSSAMRERAVRAVCTSNGHAASRVLESDTTRSLSAEHREGLEVVASREMATKREIADLSESSHPLLRTYGEIATILFEKVRPELFDAAQHPGFGSHARLAARAWNTMIAPEARDVIDDFIGEQLTNAGYWSSPRESDGVTTVRVVSATASSIHFCGVLITIDDQRDHTFWLEQYIDADQTHWTLYFDPIIKSEREQRNAMYAFNRPDQARWRVTLRGTAPTSRRIER